MGKFALPDLVANEVTSSDTQSIGTALNLACQTLLERQQLDGIGVLDVSIDAIRNAEARAHYSTEFLC